MRKPSAGRTSALTSLVVLAALLAGCGMFQKRDTAPAASAAAALSPEQAAASAASRPERMRYAAPSGTPGPEIDQLVRQPVAAVFDQAVRNLREAGLSLEHINERAGLIVARYRGDPSNYVDCGTITAETEGGGSRQVDAVNEQTSFRLRRGKDEFLVQRELILNARLVLSLKAEAGASRVKGRGVYALSKRTSVKGPEGAAVPPPAVETISFQSGARGIFEKSTTCQPTGSLERLPFVAAAS